MKIFNKNIDETKRKYFRPSRVSNSPNHEQKENQSGSKT